MTNTRPDLDALLARLDPARLGRLAERVDLPALLDAASRLDDTRLRQLAKLVSNDDGRRAAPEPPPVNADFFDLTSTLTDRQRDVQARVRRFMEEEVRPIANEYWSRDTFPRELIGKFRALDLIREIYDERAERRPDASVTEGIVTMEMARVDVSTATFFGVHSGLALVSVVMGGSEEQRAEWVPRILNMDVVGAFALTEPGVGSAAAGGLTTTCRRDGDTWVLNGEKYWIGNATFADFVVVWARDVADDQVKGFIVRTDNPGYGVRKIEGKIALRMVENGHVTLTNCRVPESDRLQHATSFRVTADVLRATRAGVAWQGVGCATGAYERALRYAQRREQFGRPISHFQLVQNLLVHMLGNVTAMQTMCLRLSQLQDAGAMRDEHASLAKVFTAARCRETVALAREVHGGNGILLDHEVARFFCDTEAIYSYEGTNEINTLVVGRAITGHGAFV
ncbi:acyl-CoA dehydrogenase family protein [Deinococcus pimensis]|uniref:acyl-CoA dehydrogenase family protein n=1 Tax=Deinococcus pimensis TaxID=309888 RepID=UPI0004801097|nr:acyl-CoA dehydrogenase family protein [Deinococcus pimensis]